jgi:hypothetical protein
MSKEEELRSKVDAIKVLLEAFTLERRVYMVVTIVSVTILLVSAIAALLKQGPPAIAAYGLFGSGGLITYSAGRVLKMWDDAMRILGAFSADKP